MILQLYPHPRLLGMVLQSDPLTLGSCKYNVIINIINITLESGPHPRFLGIALQKDLTLLDLSFF